MNWANNAISRTTQSAAPIINAGFQVRNGKEVLLKLLWINPETVENLAHAKGWGQDVTSQMLLQLISESIIKCTGRNGLQSYTVRCNCGVVARSR